MPPQLPVRMTPIDVIVPCYRNADLTRRAIEAALAAHCTASFHLIAVDDCSPEPAISSFLDELAAAGRLTLIRNPKNLGFVASVNAAMALHADRDVVLLNSDATVADGWLDALLAASRTRDQVASVTPFSNNASIASYPHICRNNDFLPAADVGAINRAAQIANAGLTAEIPVAVGFCMWISRAALDVVGPFDVARFGRGYGEEVEWCLRASRLGFSHLLAADAFVHHEGEASFGADGAALRASAQAEIDREYADFGAMVQGFIARDPLAIYRQRLDVARLAGSTAPRVLFVTHAWGGGVAKHVADLIAMIGDAAKALILEPACANPMAVRLRSADSRDALSLTYLESDWQDLESLLATLGVSRIHFHHLHGMPQAVLGLPTALALPYDVTLHDYAMLSPTYHLCDESGRYREDWATLPAPPVDRPEHARWPLSAEAWRAVFGPWLARAARVIAPSTDTASRFAAAYAGYGMAPPLVWPHSDAALTRTTRRVKVAILGGLSDVKGERVLIEALEDAHARQLAIDFVLVGYTNATLMTYPTRPLHIRGGYSSDAELAEMLALERADAIWFASQVPETFSYTLTVAMATGLTIVASHLGALPERLAGYPNARLLPFDSTARVWNDALIAAAELPARAVAAPLRVAASRA
jgi:GT2 family glycosyltransferase/glycosyltransferase involved in cell wall biosynthesis